MAKVGKVDPTLFIDYCSNGCVPEVGTITPWDFETCGCCGGVWGTDKTGQCRGIHLQGQVWVDLLEAEQGVTS